MHTAIRIISVLSATVLLSACSYIFSDYGSRRQASSSPLLEYLTNGKEIEIDATQTPHLELPLRVGLAFVPSMNYHQPVSARVQVELLNQLKHGFSSYEFIDEIVIIPSAYLGRQGGFTTVEQAANYHQVDLMALVSYEQVSNVRDTTASLLYLTILGAYIIPATENTVQTFIDTAVIHPPTRKILFSAPGIDRVDKLSTAVTSGKAVTNLGEASFKRATEQMAVNLADSLEDFRTRVREGRAATVSHRPGYGGGGAGGPLVGVAAILLLILAKRRQVQ